MPPDIFWGLTAAGWAAVAALGTLILALTTVLLVAVGLRQIFSAREEERRSRTLNACDRYDTDPVIHSCLLRLAEARRDGTLDQNGPRFRPEVATVLNYLDSLAVGITQGLYIEEIVRDHNGPIVKRHVSQYLADGRATIFEVNTENYQSLTELCNRWSQHKTFFRPNRSGLRFLRKEK